MVCDSSFLPFVRNWLRSCERAGVEVLDRTITFALDERAAADIGELGLACVPLDPSQYPAAGGSDTFGDIGFATAVFYKSAILTDLLDLGARVLFQDADLIWFDNPIPHLDAAADDVDIQLMYDGPNTLYAPLHANTGFFYVSPTSASRSVFTAALHDAGSLFWLRNDQTLLNRLFEAFMSEGALRVAILPEHRFLNGHLFPMSGDVLPDAGDWRKDGLVLHYSWTKNVQEKYQKLDRYGLNFIAGNPPNDNEEAADP